MKNSILAIFALAAMASCEKKEVVNVDANKDTVVTTAPAGTEVVTTGEGTMVGDMTAQDKTFTDAAATGGMMEVKLGDYVAANGMNAKVKELGKMMSTDHGKANSELMAWSGKVKYTLPTAMTAEQQKMVDDLMAKKGAELDKAYTDMMVSDHKKDIAAFKKESMEGTNADLKAFAAKTVPTLEMHLKSSEEAMKLVK